jgi:hypothetical protein
MKTWVNIKTGVRYPERGCNCGFEPKKTRMKYFIRGTGWLSSPLSHWRYDEIPDLPREHTVAQFREYAAQYGVACAQEFLPCCDYSKPSWAALRLSPEYPDDACTAWFTKAFGTSPHDFAISIAAVFGRWLFDIVAFEEFLAKRWGYPKDADGSMHDFMIKTFGVEVTEKFQQQFAS